MGASSVRTGGFEDLDRRLAQLERGPTKQEKAHALLKGGNILADEERRLAPKRTGRLARSIVATMEAEGQANDGNSCYIGPSLPDGWYGGFDEFGTEKEAAEPFVRPAVANKGPEALAAVVDDMAQAVKRMSS